MWLEQCSASRLGTAMPCTPAEPLLLSQEGQVPSAAPEPLSWPGMPRFCFQGEGLLPEATGRVCFQASSLLPEFFVAQGHSREGQGQTEASQRLAKVRRDNGWVMQPDSQAIQVLP